MTTDGDGPTHDYLGERVTSRQLLERYNPILVLHPRDATLKRPGSWLPTGRGDYHPSTAEFFISRLAWYPKQRGFLRGASKKQPEAAGFIRSKVVETQGGTDGWEIDIAEYSSGDSDAAWTAYGRWLQSEEEARKCVTYARCIPDGGRLALQYWYLYIYNDAGNTHEGDWEMASIELDPASGPVQVGYAGHAGGARRSWPDISKDGDRPLVFVARGSHAAYLNHMPKGHKSLHLELDKGLPPPIKQVAHLFQNVAMRTVYFWGVRDHTPPPDKGEQVTPDVRLIPDSAPVDDEDWWWMNLNCRWGSSHARISDFKAPFPPWQKPDKWLTPVAWINRQNLR
jgi:hypothetical protein